MKKILITATVLFTAWTSLSAQGYIPSEDNVKNRQELSSDRFGIFIHWGIYSTFGQGEWNLNNGKLDRKEYAKVCSDIIYDVYMKSNDTRRFGSAALELCMMASGLVDLYFEMRLQPWDYAAAGLILMEAGGAICGFDGDYPFLDRQSMVLAANNKANCDILRDIVHKHLDKLPY